MANLVTKIIPLGGEQQGEEYFDVKFADGATKTIRSWDYAAIYSVPYLYRQLFCDLLGYRSFRELGELLFKYAPKRFQCLKVLDVACGSGLMGKFLKDNSPMPIETIVGTDISIEGIEALNRDYPNIYDEAFIFRDESDFDQLKNYRFNCLSICGGANQVKLDEIKKYISFLSDGAYITFNLRTEVKGNSRKSILDWMHSELIFCESYIYNHRKLGNGTLVKHEAFMFEKPMTNQALI